MKNYILNLFTIVTILLFTWMCPMDILAQGQISRPTMNKAKQATNVHKKRSHKQSRGNVSLIPQPINIVSEPDGYLNGHGYVDLGLPSKTKWATCNIGSEEPIQEGKKYAWGEINEKTDYNEANCLTYQKHFDDISGNPTFDVSQYLWGSGWSLPTRKDLGEIEYYCKWKWIKYKGVYGIKLIGPNGKSIFLPAPQVDQWNQYYGDYWLSEPIESMVGPKNSSAWTISISEGTMVKGISNTAEGMRYRYSGQMVRPVAR